jgi:ABC-type bacteriocin/lantibiotic exporter with double-glycine peptidase domain
MSNSVRTSHGPFEGVSRAVVIFICLSRVLINALDLVGVVILGAVVGSLTGSSANFPQFIRELLPRVSGGARLIDFGGVVALGFGFFVLKSSLTLLLGYVSARYFANVEGKWAGELFSRYLRLDLGAFRSTSKEQLMHGLTYGLRAMVSERVSAQIAIVGELSLLLVISAYLAFTNGTLFLTAACYFALVGLVMARMLNKAADASITEMNRQMLRTQALLMDAADLYREVRPGSRGKSLRESFLHARTLAASNSGRYSVAITIPRHITEISLVLGVGILFAVYSFATLGKPSTAVLGVFALGVFRITAAMLPLQSNITSLRRAREEASSTRKLLDTIDAASEVRLFSANASRDSQTNFPTIEFVDFCLPQITGKVTKSLNLVIPFGSIVLVEGASGSGKSTLSDILLGIQQPTHGSVAIGGQSPGEYAARDNGIAYAQQATPIFDGTVAQNVDLEFDRAIVNFSGSGEKLANEALKTFLPTLPAGPASLIGAHGSVLSGGQLKKIALARALSSDPRILVLDEITSGLDADSNRDVLTFLGGLKGVKTVILVSHNPLDAKIADIRLRVQNGNIRVVGNLNFKTSSGEA